MAGKKSSGKSRQSGRDRAKADKRPAGLSFDRRALEAQMRQIIPDFQGFDSELDAAQQVIYEAFEERDPRRQMTLALQALEISCDCADAYVLMAEHAPTLAERIELYKQGVAAGERALGEAGFREYAGHFWGVLETRPYMRAREGLVDDLWVAGRREEAVEHCRQMLLLNPNDNQGIRYRLAMMLLDLELHEDLERLLEAYRDDGSADWAYTRVLLAFRQRGDSDAARKLLLAAKRVNSQVPAYLTHLKPMPRDVPDYYSLGNDDEAVCYAAAALRVWKETPGAVAWLRKTLRLAPAARPQSRPPWSKLRQLLARLSQPGGETWEVGMRQIEAPPQSDLAAVWVLAAFDTDGERIVYVDYFDKQPKDADVASFLIEAMQNPHAGEPHRPTVIHFNRKAWLRYWQPKLKDIAVECQFVDRLEQLDGWFDTAIPKLESGQRLAAEPSPTDLDWSRLASLPMRSEATWQADARQLPVWIQVAGEPLRPLVSLVVDGESELILSTLMEQDEAPERLLEKGVWQALCSPAAGAAHRPGTIQFSADEQRALLAKHLEAHDIRCITSSNLPHVRQPMSELADRLAGPQRIKALVMSPGLTSNQLGDFYAAAADFFRARPWRDIAGDSMIRITCRRFQSGPWYGVVMGQSGIEQGLALYEDFQLLSKMVRGELSDDESERRTSAISLTYGEAFDIAPEDLDAAQHHRWPVAGADAYPCVLRVNPGMSLRTPLKWELELLTLCLRAIPDFLLRGVSSADISVTLSGDPIVTRLERMDDQ